MEVKNAQFNLCVIQLAYKGATTNMINHVQLKHSSMQSQFSVNLVFFPVSTETSSFPCVEEVPTM